MGTNFDWRTDDDHGWNVNATEPPNEPNYRRWLILAAALLLLLGAGYIGFRRFNARVQATALGVENNVRSSYTLIHTAGRRGDSEVFDTLLSGRDPLWTDAMQQLAERNLWHDLSPLGFALVDQAPVIQAVNLSPTLASAEVSGQYTYVVNIGNGLTQTVALEHTDTFRLGQARWLLAPPDADFWQSTTVLNGPDIQITGPTRDEALFLPILRNLEATLADVCRRDPGLGCPAEIRVKIMLEREPASLVNLHDPQTLQLEDGVVTLPTPSLLGLPLDDAGSEALVRGYVRMITNSVVADLLGYRCCRQVGFFQALTDWRLMEVGRWAWPLDSADYTQLFRRQWSLDDLRGTFAKTSLDDLTPDERVGIYTAVEFAHFLAPESSVTTFQRLLGSPLNLSAWLNSIAPITFFNQDRFATTLTPDAQQQLQMFLFAHSDFPASPPAIPFPTAPLIAACREGSGMRLWQYDPRISIWRVLEQTIQTEIEQVAALPQNQGLWLVETDRGNLRVVLWRDGQRQPLDSLPAELSSTYFSYSSPDGRLVLSLTPATAATAASFEMGLLDIDACLAGNCAVTPLIGFPNWSPDGQHTLMISAENLAYLGAADGTIIRELGPALNFWAYWLNATTFGWTRLRQDVESGVEVVLSQLEDETIQALFTDDEIVAALPPNSLSRDRLAPSVVAIPDGSGRLLVDVTGYGPSDGDDYMLLYDMNTRALTRLYTAPGTLYLPTFVGNIFSAENKTFLFIQDNQPLGFASSYYDFSQLWIYDLSRQTARNYGPVSNIYGLSRSPDGQWLAAASSTYINLIAPNAGYQTLVVPPTVSCDFAGWVVEP